MFRSRLDAGTISLAGRCTGSRWIYASSRRALLTWDCATDFCYIMTTIRLEQARACSFLCPEWTRWSVPPKSGRCAVMTNPRYANGALRRKHRARLRAMGCECGICKGRFGPIHYDEPSDSAHPLSFVVDEIHPVSRWREFGYPHRRRHHHQPVRAEYVRRPGRDRGRIPLRHHRVQQVDPRFILMR